MYPTNNWHASMNIHHQYIEEKNRLEKETLEKYYEIAKDMYLRNRCVSSRDLRKELNISHDLSLRIMEKIRLEVKDVIF